MTRICQWLAGKLANALEPAEREALLGDLTESGETGWQALRDVSSLVARRQTALWKDWRAWLATAAVVIPGAPLLSWASERLANGYNLYSWVVRNYRDLDPALLAEKNMSVHHGIAQVACGSIVLLAWSWSSGFVLAALSRGATWLNGLLFCGLFLLPALSALPDRQVSFETYAVRIAALLISILGMRLGRRPAIHPAFQAIAWAAALMTALTVRSWFWWPKWTTLSALLLIAAYLPLAYLAAATIWRLYRGFSFKEAI